MLPLLLFSLACQEPAEPTQPVAPEPADGVADAMALARANEAATLLSQNLRSRMQSELAKGDLVAAARVCADEAQGLAAQVRGEKQVRVGRSSLRLRNRNNAGPVWVQTWLKGAGEVAEGVTPLSEVTDTQDGRVARVIRPIALDAECLVCHGSPEQIDPGVKAFLTERYPDDQATGYRAGDLRGALWAEAIVANP